MTWPRIPGGGGGAPAGDADEQWLRTLALCAAADVSQWARMGVAGAALATVREACITLRTLLREVSAKAATPIEPPEQTALLDATMKLPGVLMAVVPLSLIHI